MLKPNDDYQFCVKIYWSVLTIFSIDRKLKEIIDEALFAFLCKYEQENNGLFEKTAATLCLAAQRLVHAKQQGL